MQRKRAEKIPEDTARHSTYYVPSRFGHGASEDVLLKKSHRPVLHIPWRPVDRGRRVASRGCPDIAQSTTREFQGLSCELLTFRKSVSALYVEKRDVW